MAKFISTTFGSISGKHGTAVAVQNAKGEGILRIYTKPKDPKTPAQTKQRQKFGFVNKVLKPFNKVFKTTFRNNRGINQAVSYAMRNAVKEEGGELELLYENLQFAKGSLQLAENITAIRTTPKSITLSWDTTLDVEDMRPDTVNVVLMNAETHFAIVREYVALRDAGTATIDLPEVWETANILLWVYFGTPESTKTSNSQFIAELAAI